MQKRGQTYGTTSPGSNSRAQNRPKQPKTKPDETTYASKPRVLGCGGAGGAEKPRVLGGRVAARASTAEAGEAYRRSRRGAASRSRGGGGGGKRVAAQHSIRGWGWRKGVGGATATSPQQGRGRHRAADERLGQENGRG